MKAIEHDTNIPITKIPDRLHNASKELEASLRARIPFIQSKAENAISHCVFIRGSIQTPDQWTNGIWHNAKDLFNVHISPKQQWLSQDAQPNELYDVDFSYCTGVFKKCRSRKDLTLDKAVQYVVKQIKTKV